MKRKDREVTDFNEIVEIMKKCDVCRLGLNDEEYPYVVPVNFGLEVNDGTVAILFHGARRGYKHDLISKDNRAAFEMDCGHELVMDEAIGECTMKYESVMGHGHIEVVPDEEVYESLVKLMDQYHNEKFDFDKKYIPATRVYKLIVTEMTGKRWK